MRKSPLMTTGAPRPDPALDRYEGSRVLSQIAIVKEVAGVQVPGTPYATPPEALAGLAGYGNNIEASRQEARRLLKEAGVEGLSFTFKNRGIPMPYEPLGIWLIDQWRKIGVNVNQEVIEAAAYYKVLRAGEHDVAMDFQCGYIVDPDLTSTSSSQSTGTRPTTAATATVCWTISMTSKVVLPIPRSANSTFASSKNGS